HGMDSSRWWLSEARWTKPRLPATFLRLFQKTGNTKNSYSALWHYPGRDISRRGATGEALRIPGSGRIPAARELRVERTGPGTGGAPRLPRAPDPDHRSGGARRRARHHLPRDRADAHRALGTVGYRGQPVRRR